jgi:hypothetical protein
MSEYQSVYNNLISRIHTTRRKETILNFFDGLMLSLSITIGAALLIACIEIFAQGNETFRSILAAIIFFIFLLSGSILLIPSILRGFGIKNVPSDTEIALRIGKFYPDLKDRLCNVIQLIRNLDKSRGTSPQLAVAAFSDVFENSKDKKFDVIIDRRRIWRSVIIFLAVSVIFFGLMGVFQTSLGESFLRVINFGKSYLPPAPFTLSIDPVAPSALRGDAVTITIRSTGVAPDRVNIYIREEQQEKFDVFALRADSIGVYKYTISSLKQSIRFYSSSPWLNSEVRTSELSIKVMDRPQVRSLSGRIIFPAYTGLSSKEFDEQSADFSAIKGSNIELKILANKELNNAHIVVETSKILKSGSSDSSKNEVDTIAYGMHINGRSASGSFRVNASCVYYIKIRDEEGEENIEPIKYNIIALNDEFPTISLIEPRTDVQVTEEAKLPVRVTISDDYGFSGLKLFYRLAASRYTPAQENFTGMNIPILTYGNSAEVPYLWDLNKLGISAEDKYEFYVEVYDNDRVAGPKSARTRTISVRLPSLDEVLHSADQDQNQADKQLKDILKKAEDLKKDMEELDRELLKKQTNKEMEWKDKKKAEDIMKQQAELQKKLSDVQKNLEDMTKSLQENKTLSPETMEKYMELQNLLKEVNSDELRKMQEKMQQALQNMSPEQMAKLMKQIEFSEERFKKSIERTISILKRLKAEQKADALAKRAEELNKLQEDIQKQMENTNPKDKQKLDELAKKQQKAQDDLKNLLGEMKDLEKLMKEIGKDMPMDELEKAKSELDPSETMDEMQNSQSSIKSGDFNQAAKSGKKAQKNLKKFADQMKKLKDEMEKNGKREAMLKMQKAVKNLLELSEREKDLRSKTQSTDNSSTQFPELGEDQADYFEGLQNVANSMMELAQKSFSVTPEMAKNLGDALQQMQQSMQDLSNRNTPNASKAQGQAMNAMNKSAIDMQAMISQLQKSGNGSCDNPGGSGEGSPGGGGGGGMMERLRQLASQQQGINGAMQQLGQNGTMSQEQQAELGRLAAEQGRAQKSLEDLQKEQQQNPLSEKKNLANLQKIAEEMKESVSDIQNNRINTETLKRQERILSRLLDASKSINDRDFEKNRESKSGQNIFGKSPGEIDLSTQEGKTRAFQELLRSIQQGYTKDYEALIRQYFEGLQNSKIETQ